MIQKEIKQALDIVEGKLPSDNFIIPVRFEECNTQEELQEFEWIDLFAEDGFARLERAIREGMASQHEIAQHREDPNASSADNIPLAQYLVSREYNPGDFQDREEELEKVASRVTKACADNEINRSIINFWGIPGIGKSWLLRYIQEKYKYYYGKPASKRPTITALFDFRKTDNHATMTAQVAREMAKQILAQLDREDHQAIKKSLVRLVHREDETEQVKSFTRILTLLTSDFIPILLFDSTELLDEETCRDLEERVIEPVTWTEYCIIILAGRRQRLPLKQYAVRHRVEDTEIKPFERNYVEKQLYRWGFTLLADDVYALSYGHPQTTEILGVGLKRISERTTIDSTFFVKNSQAFAACLSQVEDHILEDVKPGIRAALELISVLRYFRVDQLRTFMIEFCGDEYRKKPDSFYNQMIGEMEKTNLVWRSPEHRAYVASHTVRRIINRRLDLRDRARYVRLHEKALATYQKWISELPRNSGEFIIEAVFHLAMLCRGNDWTKFRNDVQVFLEATEALSLEETQSLCDQLEEDREIEDILPREDYDRLRKEFDAVRDRKSQAPDEEPQKSRIGDNIVMSLYRRKK
jgi:hypothetical protein